MLNVAIYIYDNAEVLDFSGPYEVFSTANRFLTGKDGFNVFLLAEVNAPVLARGGFSVNPHYCLRDHPKIDVLLVVGGVHTEELKKPKVLKWLSTTGKKATIVASVCTGAFILAQAGLLSNLTVTTHWEDIDELRASYPDLSVAEGVRWVDQGKWVTSGGISAGIDMSLHLVSRLINPTIAEKTARQMAFDWHKTI
ncbi:DJ-1/PfpI family protein [Aestuariibacter sp. A3R04]|uniref:DJ-1/PfpI family protein n=1 Tax=Aestuariibacter sp. A3R04 TaxID=2841571 RepID=UPI001C09DB65|nr:DJ-1/PfpI family protein [Aestuariibacter sp. A3R04]MBU3022548.1 DJ-1/PfpI family protein [Aestuariibacter sp. A3R04]